jgi:hypothetical protein
MEVAKETMMRYAKFATTAAAFVALSASGAWAQAVNK